MFFNKNHFTIILNKDLFLIILNIINNSFIGTVSYNDETFDEVSQSLRTYYSSLESRKGAKNVRKSALTKSAEAVKALSLCHNVTPVYESSDVQVEATEADQDIQVNNF